MNAPVTAPDGRADLARRVLRQVVLYVGFVLAGVLAAGALVALTDTAPLDVARALWRGSFGTAHGISLSIDKATPLILVALGAIVASRAGMLNIGNEGQVLIGGTAAVAVALKVNGPIWFVFTLTLLAGFVGGALWVGIAALMHFTRRVDVIITTLLLNFVAIQVVSFAVNREYLLREKRIGDDLTVPQTDRIPATLHLPRIRIGGISFHSGILFALVLFGLVGYLLPRTSWGFRARMLGGNPLAARSAGVRPAVIGGAALMISGGLAGFAGGVMLTGDSFRVQTGFSQNFGYQGLLVALMARQNPLAALLLAVFFGALRAGGGFLAATGVPSYFVDVVFSVVVLAALLPPVVEPYLQRRRRARPTSGTEDIALGAG